MDAWALRSHRNAIAAIDEGRFKEEIVPIETPHGLFSVDEHPRRDTSMEKLAALKPLHPEIEGFSITAGNSSGINDAAAACVLMEAGEAQRRGLEPLGRVAAWAAAGCPPDIMGIGPAPAVRKLLARTGLSLGDIDLIELNEAFAGQALAVLKELGIADLSNINVNGSGISIGHPLGATGARILATLLHEMRRRQARYAIETMCIGGGMGLAALVERPR
jgi:acetyl-CoA C-acetyltransferase